VNKQTHLPRDDCAVQFFCVIEGDADVK